MPKSVLFAAIILMSVYATAVKALDRGPCMLGCYEHCSPTHCHCDCPYNPGGCMPGVNCVKPGATNKQMPSGTGHMPTRKP
jgi:hypothetical protein